MKDEQELQKKYVEFQLLEQQLKQTQKQLQMLEEKFIEILYTQQSLEELKNVKRGTSILVPVSSGVFAKAKLDGVDELTVNVGANTAVVKSIPATKEMLDVQIKEVQNIQGQLLEVSQKIEQQMQALEKNISSLLPKQGE